MKYRSSCPRPARGEWFESGTKFGLIALAFLCLSPLLNGKVSVSPSLVPVSIKEAFHTAHPSSSTVQFALNVDDSGISYVIDYMVDGHEYQSEYDYTEWAIPNPKVNRVDAVARDQEYLKKTNY